MTESEWLASDDPAAMLRLATGRVSRCCGCLWCDNGDGTVSMADGQRCCRECDNATPAAGYQRIAGDRKLRLFACACVRRATQMFTGMTGRQNRLAIEAAELFADGLCHATAVQTGSWFSQRIYDGIHRAESERILRLVRLVGGPVHRPEEPGGLPLPDPDADHSGILVIRRQAAILRDVVGNPYRRYAWTDCHDCRPSGHELQFLDERWRTPTVLAVARRVYDDRDFAAMPVLADTLEDAGCTDEAMLRHCRGQEPVLRQVGGPGGQVVHAPVYRLVGWSPLRGPHVRGCWAVDLILGKE